MSDHAKVSIGGKSLNFRFSWRAMRNLSEKYKKPFQEVLSMLGEAEGMEVLEDAIFFGLEAGGNPMDREELQHVMDFADFESYIEAIVAACPKNVQAAIKAEAGNE